MTNLTPGEIKNAPAINLGGRTFNIPKLTPKQNRVVVGALSGILPVITRLESTLRNATDPAATAIAIMKDFPLDDVTFDKCLDAIYAACTRGAPELGRAEFDDLPIGIDEILMALPVVMMQSFAFVTKKQEAGPQPAPGELSTRSIGIESSSESVAQPAGPGITSNVA